MVDEGDGDDLLAELLGDDMPVATSSGFDNVADVEENVDTKPTRGKKREKKDATENSPSVPAAKRIKENPEGEQEELSEKKPLVMPTFTVVSGRL